MTPEMLAVRTRLRDDFEFYAQHALKIRTKGSQITPFRINKAQQMLCEAVARQEEETGKARVVILKARQLGLSTVVGGRMFWRATQSNARKAIVVAHKAESARSLFDMTQRFFDQCPEILKPHSKYSSRKELVFDVLQSSYMVATAGGDGIARGETITDAHLSELAFWPDDSAVDNYVGLMQAIPNARGTSIYIESTAFGVSGLFATAWEEAVKGENGFMPLFVPWFVADEYRVPVRKTFERSPEERELVAEFGLDDEQLLFRRQKVAEVGLDKFHQEYPSNAREAFLTSGRPVFNPVQIAERLEQVPLRAPMRMDPEGDTWVEAPRGILHVYEPRKASERYYIGADVGAGVDKDWSVAQVLNSKGVQVATLRAQLDPDHYATILNHLGRYYHHARIIVESNNHGLLTCSRLGKDMAYPNFYTEKVHDQLSDKDTIRLGFDTNKKSKPFIIDKLRSEVRNGKIILNDFVTLKEMQSFIVHENGKMAAEKGSHDDTVMALALANHINEGNFTPIVNDDNWYVQAV